MAQFGIDARILDGPIYGISASAMGLWVRVIAWALTQHSTYVPPRLIISMGGGRRDAAELVAVGLWEVVPTGGWEMILSEYWSFAPRANPRRPIAPSLRRSIFERDGHRCVECGATERLSLDHKIPYSAGGSDRPNNLQTLCVPCNSRKGSKV